MINKSMLGASAVIVATGLAAIGLAALASPAFAAHHGGSTYSAPAQTGGRSAGSTNRFPTDYRLWQNPREGYPYR